MKRYLLTLLALTLVGLTLILLPAPTPSPEDLIARLPGVGAGWLDTLERVVGPVTYDTVSDLEVFDSNGDLIGIFERWHNLISVRVKMISYYRYQRHYSNGDACRAFSYIHPVEIAGSPAGTLAHEFGHLFQFRARPHVVPEPGDSLPRWARDNIDERYADRFARAMLALRGWAEPDSADQVLNHRVRYLLMKSYWPASTPVIPRPVTPADGTATHAHHSKKVFASHPDF